MKSKPQPISSLKLDMSIHHQVFNENYRIKHKIAKSQTNTRIHTHNFYEILLCTSDDLYFLINDLVYPIKRNDLILLNDTDVHGVISTKDLLFERYVIEFDPAYTKDLCSITNILQCFERKSNDISNIYPLSYERAELFLSLFNKLASFENNSDSFGLELYKKIVFAELLLQVNRIVLDTDGQTTPSDSKSFGRIQTILSYINSHLADDLSLETLSEHFFISTSYLSSIFKASTGFTVNNYIINQRIILATKLLKQNMTVSSVCEQCGFTSYAHFIRTFKKYEGISPKQYAKRENTPN